jgi:hypothetical protein
VIRVISAELFEGEDGRVILTEKDQELLDSLAAALGMAPAHYRGILAETTL